MHIQQGRENRIRFLFIIKNDSEAVLHAVKGEQLLFKLQNIDSLSSTNSGKQTISVRSKVIFFACFLIHRNVLWPFKLTHVRMA